LFISSVVFTVRCFRANSNIDVILYN
jgi:hypothetical protein